MFWRKRIWMKEGVLQMNVNTYTYLELVIYFLLVNNVASINLFNYFKCSQYKLVSFKLC